ncbi:MAG: helix-turn-helix domain-containing protein [Actinomycetota bacterium]
MELGSVLRKERERARLSVQAMASRLKLSQEKYEALESGTSLLEQWGTVWGYMSVALKTPMSQLVSPTGKSADVTPGQTATLIRNSRTKREQSPEEVAEKVGLTTDVCQAIEAGELPQFEDSGLWLLRFAEAIPMPVFNLIYPCGLLFTEIPDYS